MLVALAMALHGLVAVAKDVSVNLPRPDGKPGNPAKPVKVYILAGQSNMVGLGASTNDLSADQKKTFADIKIYLDAEGDALLTIPGNPPNLLRLPKGCPFQPRCPHAMEQCSSAPPLESFAPGRLRACFKPVGDLL